MGGTIAARGNTPIVTAEYNIYTDPEAAYITLAAFPDSTMLSWETTLAHGFAWDKFNRLCAIDTVNGRFFKAISQATAERLEGAYQRPAYLLPDPLAMAITLRPELIQQSGKYHVTVELNGRHTRGQTVIDYIGDYVNGERANCNVIQALDTEGVYEMFVSCTIVGLTPHPAAPSPTRSEPEPGRPKRYIRLDGRANGSPLQLPIQLVVNITCDKLRRLRIYLLANISADAACAPEAIYARLTRLLEAPAPANSCALPGAVGDVIRALVAELGLPGAPIDMSGNLVIEIGDPDAPLGSAGNGAHGPPLLPRAGFGRCDLVSALRDPCAGRKLRMRSAGAALCRQPRQRGCNVGRLHFAADGNDYQIRFLADEGELAAGDTVMMHCAPTAQRRLGQRHGPRQRHRRTAGAAIGRIRALIEHAS